MRVLGVLGGGLLVVFGVMHSVMGWPALMMELRQLAVPEDVIAGLLMPWHFSGLAMVIFGGVGMGSALAGRRMFRPAAAAMAVGSACAVFGGAAAVFVSGVPLMVFGLPGVLLLASGYLAARRPPC